MSKTIWEKYADVLVDYSTNVQKGDIVICKPGEKIAVDGEIIEGTTHIDESFITGESVPKDSLKYTSKQQPMNSSNT